jgi:AP endonuclease 1
MAMISASQGVFRSSKMTSWWIIFLFYNLIMRSIAYRYHIRPHTYHHLIHSLRLHSSSSIILPTDNSHPKESKLISASEAISSSISKVSIASWNVNGLRSLLKHDHDSSVLRGLIARRQVDILCLQETKLQEMHTAEMDIVLRERIGAKKIYWTSSRARKGYSGLATIILNDQLLNNGKLFADAIGEAEGDIEGRTLTYLHEKFIIVNVYTPNSGDGLRRLEYRTERWDRQFSSYLNQLRLDHPRHPIIVTGDLNVAHQAIDYHNYHKSASKLCAGTTPQEQLSFAENLLSAAKLQVS